MSHTTSRFSHLLKAGYCWKHIVFSSQASHPPGTQGVSVWAALLAGIARPARQEPSREQTWARCLAQQHQKSRRAALFALGRLDRCDSEETVAKFWLLAHPTEPADLQPAAGAASTAQALAALQGNSWKGRYRQGTWGHYSMSLQNREKQSPPLLHLELPR